MIEVLIGLIVALVVVAMVGHGLWLLAGAIFKGMFGEAPTPPQRTPQRAAHEPQTSERAQGLCPICTAPMTPMSPRCEECGWPQSKPSPERGKKIALDRLRKLAGRFK